ncbi:MAG: hypothetical protein GQ565_11060 [Candidatus Aegiribacteria sp.]|nr:hypothetical protein [Candidatus Aegiribacteria sp.]
MVTRIEPFEDFWVAENNHQNYYRNNGKTPCHIRTNRFDD